MDCTYDSLRWHVCFILLYFGLHVVSSFVRAVLCMFRFAICSLLSFLTSFCHAWDPPLSSMFSRSCFFNTYILTIKSSCTLLSSILISVESPSPCISQDWCNSDTSLSHRPARRITLLLSILPLEAVMILTEASSADRALTRYIGNFRTGV